MRRAVSFQSTLSDKVATMLLRWLFLLSMTATMSAHADDLVSTTQVVNALAAHVLVADPFGNASQISQSGYDNIAQTGQTGSGGKAAIRQVGNNDYSFIQQIGSGDTAVNTQIGNGLRMTIHQTGPGQAISIIQR